MSLLSQYLGDIVDECKPLKSAFKHRIFIMVLVFCVFIQFYQLGGLALISPDEGRNAEVAREMNLANAWLVPTYDGLNYLDKPAFYFKTVALSFALFGESEAAARFSSASFGLLLLLAVFLFCKRVYDERTAIFASLIVATTPLFIGFSRIVIFDMTLAFFVCSSIFACYLAEECQPEQRTRWYFIAAVAGAIATLVKGPVGFILPILVISLFNLFEGRIKVMKQAFALRNWLVFFAIVLPWFAGLSLECPDFPYYGIMRESVARFTTNEFHRTQPFYYYALIIATTFFAWSLLLPESIYALWRSRDKLTRADRLFIIWAIAVVIFFSISKSKLPGYILTAIVALGILTARVFAKAMENNNSRAQQLIWRGTIPLYLLSAGLAIVVVVLVVNPEIALSQFKIKPEHFYLVYPSLTSLAVSFFIIALVSAIAFWTRLTPLIFLAFISVPLMMLTVNFELLSHYGQSRSAKSLARQIPDLPETTKIACIQCMPNGLPFYLKRLITVFSVDGKELTSNYVEFTLKTANPWPDGIVPLAQMQNWLKSRDHAVYLLAHEGNLPQLKAIASLYKLKVQALPKGYYAVLIPKPGT